MMRTEPTGFVTQVEWACWGFDGIYQSNCKGTVSYDDNGGNPNFTPFSELTEDQVISWVKNSVGEAEVIAAIDEAIDAYIKPSQTAGIPWFSPAEL